MMDGGISVQMKMQKTLRKHNTSLFEQFARGRQVSTALSQPVLKQVHDAQLLRFG